MLNQTSLEKLFTFINSRGPDYNSPLCDQRARCGLRLRLKASILHLRGDKMVKQPVISDNGDMLLFNGQIYEFSGDLLPERTSDTLFLWNKLRYLKTKQEVCSVFSNIDGPFSFIYWCNNLNSLFYGRDIFGRKSLCQVSGGAEQYPLIISSVGVREKFLVEGLYWTEVDCTGLHCLDFSSGVKKSRFTWEIDHIYPITPKCSIASKLQSIGVTSYPLAMPSLKPLCNSSTIFQVEQVQMFYKPLEELLLSAVRKRVIFNRDTCLNCRKTSSPECKHSKVAVAFSGGIDSTLIALFLDRVLNKSETIDLLNVAFRPNSPDREATGQAFKELRQLCPQRNYRLVLSDECESNLKVCRLNSIRHVILPCQTVIDDSLGCGLWFISRGWGRALNSSIDDEELSRIYDIFLAYDIQNTKHSNLSSDVDHEYKSPASMIFVGTGIDEQLGGYSSFRSAWRENGTDGLFREISFQMRRISSRNMGRDDRCCSDHGRDVKLPYLDYQLVSFLNTLPPAVKMNLTLPVELGPKFLLRMLAKELGLKETYKRTKRALQFGTRIANLEDSHEKGGDLCSRLM